MRSWRAVRLMATSSPCLFSLLGASLAIASTEAPWTDLGLILGLQTGEGGATTVEVGGWADPSNLQTDAGLPGDLTFPGDSESAFLFLTDHRRISMGEEWKVSLEVKPSWTNFPVESVVHFQGSDLLFFQGSRLRSVLVVSEEEVSEIFLDEPLREWVAVNLVAGNDWNTIEIEGHSVRVDRPVQDHRRIGFRGADGEWSVRVNSVDSAGNATQAVLGKEARPSDSAGLASQGRLDAIRDGLNAVSSRSGLDLAKIRERRILAKILDGDGTAIEHGIVFVDSESGDDALDGSLPVKTSGRNGPKESIASAMEISEHGGVIVLIGDSHLIEGSHWPSGKNVKLVTIGVNVKLATTEPMARGSGERYLVRPMLEPPEVGE